MVVLHSDLNNFYATVEKKLFPELAGKPVAVCGDKEARHGIVLAKSEEAKAFGVKTGDVIWQAKQKEPNLKCVPPHFSQYMQYSSQVFNIYTRYTSRVEPFGPDECWLDCTGSQKLFGDGKTIADNIRFGKLDATQEEIEKAAKIANADSFIRRLPNGYNTMVTSDGANLSQGQRQLLAIARAAVAKPPVLVLDEATSSIDTRTVSLPTGFRPFTTPTQLWCSSTAKSSNAATTKTCFGKKACIIGFITVCLN